MNLRRFIRGVSLASIVCCAMLSPASAPLAAQYLEFADPHPAPGNYFGSTVVVLSTGNVVVTSPLDDRGGTDAGAVYLFSGSTGLLISTLRGSSNNDYVGSGGVTALANGNYVILSTNWHNGGAANAGAATWGSGTTGVSGVVSSANSLIGSATDDAVSNTVTALTNGNYVVVSPFWNKGGIAKAGAATWGNGLSGVSGVVSVANSLVGSTASDFVGTTGVTALSNGSYVVTSPDWNKGAVVDAGAAT